MHKEFKLQSLQGVPIKYNPRSDIFNRSNAVSSNEYIRYVNEILFVYDIVQFSLSKDEEQKKLEIWYRVLNRYIQEMSIPKTNLMRTGLGSDNEIGVIVNINGVKIKLVKKFRYLGIIERYDNTMESEFNARKRAMKCAFREYQMHIFSNKHLSITSRINLYSVLVLSAMLYGCSL